MKQSNSRYSRRAVETGKAYREVERCDDAGKTIYRTRRKALRENGKLSRRGGAAEAYVCRFCGFWHLTTPRS